MEKGSQHTVCAHQHLKWLDQEEVWFDAHPDSPQITIQKETLIILSNRHRIEATCSMVLYLEVMEVEETLRKHCMINSACDISYN